MIRQLARFSSFTALLILVSINASAINYYNGGNGYQVGVVRPGGDRPCTLFTLSGVSIVDASIAPNSPWFVLEHSLPEYSQMVATLLTAKATGRPIQVETTGVLSSACFHPIANVIVML